MQELFLFSKTIFLHTGSPRGTLGEQVPPVEEDFLFEETYFLLPETESLCIEIGNFKSPAPQNFK